MAELWQQLEKTINVAENTQTQLKVWYMTHWYDYVRLFNVLRHTDKSPVDISTDRFVEFAEFVESDVVENIKKAYEDRVAAAAAAVNAIKVDARHINIYEGIYKPMFAILGMPVGVSLLDVPDYPVFTRNLLFPAILATAVKWQHDRAREKRLAHYAAWQADASVFTNISNHCRPLEVVLPCATKTDKTDEPAKTWRVRACRRLTYSHKVGRGCHEYNLLISAIQQLQAHFAASDRMHTLLQSCVVGGYLCTRLVQYVTDAADIRKQLREADSGRAYIIFSRRMSEPPEEFPVRVKNDATGADYVIVSFLSGMHTHTHATYTNMTRRENVDNLAANRTPSAMVADKNTYYTSAGWPGFADNYGDPAGVSYSLLARAIVLLYRRDDTMPSQIIT